LIRLFPEKRAQFIAGRRPVNARSHKKTNAGVANPAFAQSIKEGGQKLVHASSPETV